MRKAIAGIFLCALLAAQPAFAHPGHDIGQGIGAGFVHPFTGLDHMLVMIAVGLWAGLSLRDKWWVWPAAFVIFMLGGFAFGAMGGVFPGAEAIIAASLIGIGLSLAFNYRPSTAIGGAIIAFFAVAHGFAHGAEMPPHSNVLGFAAGFGTATILLHAVGLAIAAGLARWSARPAARVAGGGIAVTGLLIALAG